MNVSTLFDSTASLADWMMVVGFSSLIIIVSAATVASLLKRKPIQSSRINQLLWLLVVLPGVLLIRWPIEVPEFSLFDANNVEPISKAVSEPEQPNRPETRLSAVDHSLLDSGHTVPEELPA